MACRPSASNERCLRWPAPLGCSTRAVGNIWGLSYSGWRLDREGTQAAWGHETTLGTLASDLSASESNFVMWPVPFGCFNLQCKELGHSPIGAGGLIGGGTVWEEHPARDSWIRRVTEPLCARWWVVFLRPKHSMRGGESLGVPNVLCTMFEAIPTGAASWTRGGQTFLVRPLADSTESLGPPSQAVLGGL